MLDNVEHIRITPKLDKIVEAILHIITLGDEKSAQENNKFLVTQYDIVKTIFLADKSHLNKYGRPITFDNYIAMNHGPVPSMTYDVLKNKPSILTKYGSIFPWNFKDIGDNKKCYYAAQRHYNQDILSPSDAEALTNSFTIVKSLGFTQIRKLTHEDPAYQEAWRDEGSKNKSFEMIYGLLFDTPNYEKAREIKFLSEHT